MAIPLRSSIKPNGMGEGDLYAVLANLRDVVNELQAAHATNRTLMADNKALLNALRTQIFNRAMGSPGLVIGSGATTSYRHGTDSAYLAGGIFGAMGAAADHAFTSAHVITQNLWGVFLITLSAGGTWKTTVPSATQAYASEAAAIAAMPAPPADEAIIGYITIRARSTVNFTANTTNLTADNGVGNSQTVNYYNGGFDDLPSTAAVSSSPADALTNSTAITLDPPA